MGRLYNRIDLLAGATIYPLGDAIGASLTGEWSLERTIGLGVVGALVYAAEIPHYFRWLNQKITQPSSFGLKLAKAALGVAYFNPLWIARHYLFIAFFSGAIQTVGWNTLHQATFAFVQALPFTMLANYLVQNPLPLRWRFVVSAIVSAMMSCYYAVMKG